MIVGRAVGYRFVGGAQIGPIDVEVRAGELTVLAGRTGSGKSVLARRLAGVLGALGHGEVLGQVVVAGDVLDGATPAQRAAAIGLVGQEVRDQIVAGTIADELAFGLRLRGEDEALIGRRVSEGLGRIGLSGDRDPTALSGGEQQKVAVEAVLANGARALILDEPLAHLDADAARGLLAALRRHADRGRAVLIVEHRLEPLWAVADRLIVLRDGALVADGRPADLDLDALRGAGLRVPSFVDLLDRALRDRRAPEAWIDAASPPPQAASPRAHLGAWDLDARVGGEVRLHPTRLTLDRGERVGVIGANGAGKSTLLRALADRGGPAFAVVPQDPDLTLFAATTYDEVAYAARERGLPVEPDTGHRLRAFDLDGLGHRAPQSLSRGQRLRLAVAALAATSPDVLLLDEPTAGQDGDAITAMFDVLTQWPGAVVFASHDLDVIARYATRVLWVDGGRVRADGETDAVLAEAVRSGVAAPRLHRWCVQAGRSIVRAERAVGAAR